MANRTLYFVWVIGCDACAEAKPHAKRLAEERSDDVEVRYIELTALETNGDEDIVLPIPESPVLLTAPDSIPAYVVVYADGTPPRTLSSRGALSFDELVAWVFAL
ncbi:MAG: hypothetical protein Q7R30_22830 [Acidobacteriota bacterium]|nr:hypothetical protein [Acidobacteriota bacterium]